MLSLQCFFIFRFRSELRWLTPGTLVNIVEVDADENNCFHIERLQGYLIVDPDQLISATTVISQMFCDRKVGLSRLSPGGDSPIAFRGVLAHELICRVCLLPIPHCLNNT